MRTVVLFAALFALSTPAAADELAVEGDRFYLPVEVGGITVEALLDSGAETSILDPEFAGRAGIVGGEDVEARGTGAGTTAAKLVEGVRFRALGRTITSEAVAVMDMRPVFARLGIRQVDMVLGRELFDAGRLAIDLQRGTIDWAPEDSPMGARIPLTANKGIETVPVTIDGVPVQADFDIGNGTGLLLSQALAERLALQPVGVEPAGGIGATVWRPVVYVEKLAIAGQSFGHVRAHVTPETEESANIGAGLLRNFHIVTDFPGRAVWLSPRK